MIKAGKSLLIHYINYSLDKQEMEKLCVNFDPKPKATIGFVSIPSDITLDTEAPHLLSQISGVLWRFTKMGFDGFLRG